MKLPQVEGDRETWEYHTVTLTRVPNYGFGIAVSGGRDNAHFANGDHSIVISDVLKAGPAEGKLMINDRVITANGVSLENVDYAYAVHVLREFGPIVNLVIKRRVVLPPSVSEAQTLRVTLRKSKKKDDFGIILGCRIYVKEITNESLLEKSASVREGDIITQINKTSTENLTLKDAKKLMDSSREKLQLVVRREPRKEEDSHRSAFRTLSDPFYGQVKDRSSPSKFIDVSTNRTHWGNQNVYIPSPTRGNYVASLERTEDKNNLFRPPDGLTQRDLEGRLPPDHFQPMTANQISSMYPRLPEGTLEERGRPPRPPLPLMNEFEGRQGPPHSQGTSTSNVPLSSPDIRYISYHKDGSMGFRLTGGNEVGVFVSAVYAGSAPHLQGLQQGDKILKVNDTDTKNLTREDVIMLLLNAQNQVNLTIRHCKEEFEEAVASGKRGDSFYIRTHFSYESSAKGELSFVKGEVFHVVDTLYNDAVGSWLVYRVGNNGQVIQKGVIPNRIRAEEYAQMHEAQANKGKVDSRGSFFKRRARRHKALNKITWEDIVFGDGDVKFPAYEEVTLKHPGFLRPVVLYGTLSDVAKSKLLEDLSNRFESPKVDSWVDVIPKAQKSFGIFRLKAIRDIMQKEKHALLDIPPSALERLNYTQLYPIVLFLRAENKNILKELLDQHSKANLRDMRKLYEQETKLEKIWFQAFSGVLPLTADGSWYKNLKETISKQQQQKIWMATNKPPNNVVSDDFLLPVSPRLNCTSSESDREPTTGSPTLDPHGDGPPNKDRRLARSSSDPNLTADKHVLAGPHFQNSFSSSFVRPEQPFAGIQPSYGPASRKCFTLPVNPDEVPYPPRDRSISPAFEQRGVQDEPKYSRYPPPPLTSFVGGRPVYSPPAPGPRAAEGRPPPPLRNLSLPRRTWMPQSDPTLNSLFREKGPPRVQIDLARYGQNRTSPATPLPGYPSAAYAIKEAAIMPPRMAIPRKNPYSVPQERTNHPLQRVEYNNNNNNLDDPGVEAVSHQMYDDDNNCYQRQVNEGGPGIPEDNLDTPYDPDDDEPPPNLPSPPPLIDNWGSNEQSSGAFNKYKEYNGTAGEVQSELNSTEDPENNEYNVIDTVRGVFDKTGGVLSSTKTGVRLIVPPGAIDDGEPQEVYFKVCQDTSMMPTVDEQTGEVLMSPLVMCGPHGLQFNVPVELHLPHCASVGPDGWTLSSSKSNSGGTGEARDVEKDNFITVPVDHF